MRLWSHMPRKPWLPTSLGTSPLKPNTFFTYVVSTHRTSVCGGFGQLVKEAGAGAETVVKVEEVGEVEEGGHGRRGSQLEIEDLDDID